MQSNSPAVPLERVGKSISAGLGSIPVNNIVLRYFYEQKRSAHINER